MILLTLSLQNELVLPLPLSLTRNSFALCFWKFLWWMRVLLLNEKNEGKWWDTYEDLVVVFEPLGASYLGEISFSIAWGKGPSLSLCVQCYLWSILRGHSVARVCCRLMCCFASSVLRKREVAARAFDTQPCAGLPHQHPLLTLCIPFFLSYTRLVIVL